MQVPLRDINSAMAAVVTAATEIGARQETEKPLPVIVNGLADGMKQTAQLICLALQEGRLEFHSIPMSFWFYLVDYQPELFSKMLYFYQTRICRFYEPS